MQKLKNSSKRGFFLGSMMVLFLFSTMQTVAQKNRADSLRIAIKQSTSDSAKYTNYVELGDYFYLTQIYNDSAFYYTEKALVYSQEGTVDRARALFNLGSIQKSLGNYDEAIGYYKDSKAILSDLGMDRIVSSCLNNIGAVYFDRGDYNEAIVNYRSALEIAQTHKDGIAIAIDLMNIGEALYRKDELIGSKNELEKALFILDTINEERPTEAHFFYAQTLFGLEDFKESEVHAKIALAFAEKREDLASISMVSNLLSKILQEEGDYEKALFYTQQFALYNDSISSARALNEVEKLKLNLELSEKQENIDRYKERDKYLMIIYALLIGGVLVVGVLIAGLIRIRRMKQEMRDIQLDLLKTKEE